MATSGEELYIWTLQSYIYIYIRVTFPNAWSFSDFTTQLLAGHKRCILLSVTANPEICNMAGDITERGLVNLTLLVSSKLQEISNESEIQPTTDDITPTMCSNVYCDTDEDYVDRILDYLFPLHYEWVIIALYTLVFLVGLIGNFLVCFAVWRNKNMQTLTNCFIVNLAVADILVLLVCLPATVVEDILQTWFTGSYTCKIIKYCQVNNLYVYTYVYLFCFT